MEALINKKHQRALRKTATRGGTKRALLIGINYTGSKNALKGCINDVKMMKGLLLSLGYEEKNILMLTDDTILPTKQNILQYISVCVAATKPGDVLYFHYSGHGTRVKDTNGDEDDGLDEAIVPIDFTKAGLIIDDDLKQYLINPLPQDSNLFVALDCCNSGTALDLKFNFIPLQGTSGEVNQVLLPYPLTACNCLVLSSCKADQLSDEISTGSSPQGILTVAFYNVMRDLTDRARTAKDMTLSYKNPKDKLLKQVEPSRDLLSDMFDSLGMTFNGLVTAIYNAYIKLGGTQVPQISSGRYMKPSLTM